MQSKNKLQRTSLEQVSTVTVGGLPISVLDRAETADLMLNLVKDRPRGQKPLYFTSANGEVIARTQSNKEIDVLFKQADQIVADGQPMVLASRWLCKEKLPERVATSDLFHDVSRRAEKTGQSFFMLGASPEENAKAVECVQKKYPNLNIIGHCHGFLDTEEMEAKIDEINALSPDILWLSLGVPREQIFIQEHSSKLHSVGLIKTSGGLFNFLSGTNQRAPKWMQDAGLEWLFRLWLEPKRLFWRYLSTNPKAMFLILTRSQ